MSQQSFKEKLGVFSTRLKARRQRLGWSQADLAKELRKSTGNISNWESGGNIPHPATLRKLADVLGVSVGYLLGDDQLERKEETAGWKESPPNYKTSGNVQILPNVSRLPKHLIPVISWANAGLGGVFTDMEAQIDERIESDCPDRNAYALIIEGDSMMPRYEPGDQVVFLPNSEARNGDIVVARLAETGEVFFKMIHFIGPKQDMVRLTSYNEMYPPLEYPKSAFRFIHPMYEMRRRARRA